MTRSFEQRHGRNAFGHLDIVVVNAGIGEPDSARFMDMRKGADGEPTVREPFSSLASLEKLTRPPSQKPTMPTLAVNLTGAAYSTSSSSST